MIAGEHFDKYGFNWRALSVTPDRNESFNWLVVKAIWSGHGPRPNWANEEKTFLNNRQPNKPTKGHRQHG